MGSFEDIAREHGLDEYDNNYHDSVNPSDLGTYKQNDYGIYNGSDEIDDLMDEIDRLSSPSPPERNTGSSARAGYGLAQRLTHYTPPVHAHDHIEIAEFDDAMDPGQFYYQPFSGPTASSSRLHISGNPQPLQAPQFIPRQPLYAALPAPRFAASINQPRSSAPSACAQQNLYGEQTFGQTPFPSRPRHPVEERPRDAGASNMNRGNEPRNAHAIRLRPVSELPDIYRGMFKFGVFNAVQSKCFDTVMHTDENMVISAPTGSGKTVLFELAIIKMLTEAGGNSRACKCIYVAPTKALCSEKCRDWTDKFQPLGINCCELTGDTVTFGKSAWGNARDAAIIVTTGEKWDSLTRNWSDHEHILSQIQLFLVDEVHILNETRGSTLEVVISRMKTRGTSVRFVVVSATVPNIEDVANWVGDGTSDGAATIMQFGDEFRPCKLSKFVYAVPKKRDQNDFSYQHTLDFRLYAILQQHSVNKPMLVFCATRKGVMSTAEQLFKEYEDATNKKQTLPWSRPPRIERDFHNKQLQKLAVAGIGVHHAGLNMDDRRAIEDLYLNKILRVVVATSTLAVGVNLPAHTVVIKGVKMFQGNSMQEYSDMDIIQMMGRAGRPQFDKEGVAIIMCEPELEAKYNALAQGRTQLESCLHLNLSEHVNSEIGLGTINNLNAAKEWLRNSFLFQRIQRNPKHYAIGKDSNQTWQARVDEMVIQSVNTLQESQLVTTTDEAGGLTSTEFGDIMSKFYIRQGTMSLLLKLPERANLREVLETLSSAEEFSDVRLRAGEKQVYNKMRTHTDIRFQIKKVEKPADKVFILIQAVLGGLSLSDPEYKTADSNPSLESLGVFRHVARLARALVDVAVIKQMGAQIKHGLEALRCLTAKAWDDRPIVLRQVEQIGGKSLMILAERGITSFSELRKQDPLRLETLLSRRPPFGLEILTFVNQLPQYSVTISEVEVTKGGGERPVVVELCIECGLVMEDALAVRSKKPKSKRTDMTSVFTLTSDLDYIDFRRIPTRLLKDTKTFEVTAELKKPSQSVIVYMTSETIAGVMVSATYKPSLEARHYPIMDTRPQTSVEMMLVGFDEDPDFWKLCPDDCDEDDAVITVKDLTQKSNVSQEGRKPSVSQKVSTRNEAKPSGLSLGAKQLPGGKFECNHSCKDKTKCRHFCCQNGLDKPPPMSKRNVDAVCASNQVSTHSNNQPGSPTTNRSQIAIKSKSMPKPKPKPCDKPDARLKHLESLHKNTNVQENLKISKEHRIKVDDANSSPSAAKGQNKNRIAPSFDLVFVDLGEDRKQASNPNLDEIGDSDTELPEPQEILDAYDGAARSRPLSDPSETNYSNSEVDALIRDAPLYDYSVGDYSAGGNFDYVPLAAQIPVRDTPSSPLPTWTTLSSSPLSKKRKGIEEHSIPPPPKRPRALSKRADNLQKKTASRLTPPAGRAEQSQPLFIADSPETEPEHDAHTALDPMQSPVRLNSYRDGEFVLDESLFDIIPSTPALSASTSSGYPPNSLCPTSSSFSGEVSARPIEPQVTNNSRQETQWSEEDDKMADSWDRDFAELEAWINGGGVELVD